jgi:Tol biopolymer transport system component
MFAATTRSPGEGAVRPDRPRTRARSLTATTAALCLTLLFVASKAFATFPGGNGNLAITSTRDGHEQIYVMSADGSRQTNVSRNPANDSQPAWSPDGTRLAFTSDRNGHQQIYVMNANGSGQTNVTHSSTNDSEPAWSPDGKRIAFTRDRAGHRQIFVVNADGKAQINVSHNPVDDWQPAWSPDGRTIAFTTDRDLVACPNCHFGDQFIEEIYVMGADGRSPIRLTHNVWGDKAPGWSPDGRKIGFMHGTRFGDLSVAMNADGTDLTFLIQSSDLFSYAQPTWSPNGARIAFAHSFLGSDLAGHSGIFVIDVAADGTLDLHRQVDVSHNSTGDSDDVEPDWQPTLPTIADQCKRGGWRNYGQRFKNQGDCVSFVRTGR